MIGLGEVVEDFELKDQDRNGFRLSDYRGKKTLLSFHPLAWTPVCRDQMLSLERNHDGFSSLNTIPVGISVDSTFSKKAWADAIGIKRLRMLSDFWPHGAVAQKLGLFRERDGFSERANLILDEEGKVIFIKVYQISQLPPIEEIFDALKKG